MTARRDPRPCSDFRPAIPRVNADQRCRCGWPRSMFDHGDTGDVPFRDRLDAIWARIVREHNARYHPGRDCPDLDRPCPYVPGNPPL